MNSTIEKPHLTPVNYGTRVEITDYSTYTCPSDGIIQVTYGGTSQGYLYLQIGNLVNLFTGKSTSEPWGRAWVFPAFKGNLVTIAKEGDGRAFFVPYTY